MAEPMTPQRLDEIPQEAVIAAASRLDQLNIQAVAGFAAEEISWVARQMLEAAAPFLLAELAGDRLDKLQDVPTVDDVPWPGGIEPS